MSPTRARVLLLLSLAVPPAHATSGPWGYFDDRPGRVFGRAEDLRFLSDGNLSFVGMLPSAGGTFVARIDSGGALVSQAVLTPGSGWEPLSHVAELSNGHLVLAGLASGLSTIVSVAPDGTLDWAVELDPTHAVRGVSAAPSGGVLVTGDIGPGDATTWALLLSADGSLAWQRTFSSPPMQIARALTTATGDLLLIATAHGVVTGPSGQPGLAPVVVCLDEAGGSVRWSRAIDTESGTAILENVASSPDGGFYTVTETVDFEWNPTKRVTRWLASGNASWTREMGDATIHALAAAPDAGVLLLTGGPGPTGFAWRERFGPDGTASWAQFEGNDSAAVREMSHARVAFSSSGTLAEAFEGDSHEMFGAAFVVLTADSGTDVPAGCFRMEGRSPRSTPLASSAAWQAITVQDGPGTAILGPPSAAVTSSPALATPRQCIPCTTRLDDSDRDFIQRSCDNCPSHRNNDQADGDADGRGDACDAGWVPLPSGPGSGVPLRVSRAAGAVHVTWEGVVATSYALYRGTIAALEAGSLDHRSAGACDLGTPEVFLADEPGSFYFLAAARQGTDESSLGDDSFGNERIDASPRCP